VPIARRRRVRCPPPPQCNRFSRRAAAGSSPRGRAWPKPWPRIGRCTSACSAISFGDGLWAATDQAFRKYPDVKVHQFSHEGTGFTRYRTRDLLEDAKARVAAQPIDLALISIGANDTQGLFVDGHAAPYMSAAWQQTIEGRMTALVRMLQQRGVAVGWVGLPRMRDADFDRDIQAMNRFQAKVTCRLGVPFADAVPVSQDRQRRFALRLIDPATGKDYLARANDGKHMTFHGYEVISRPVVQPILALLAPPAAKPAAPAPAPTAPAPSATGTPPVHRKRPPVETPHPAPTAKSTDLPTDLLPHKPTDLSTASARSSADPRRPARTRKRIATRIGTGPSPGPSLRRLPPLHPPALAPPAGNAHDRPPFCRPICPHPACSGHLAGAVLSPAAVAAQSGAPVDLTLPAAPSAPPLPAITAAVPGQLSNAAAIAPFLAQLATAPATGVLSIVQIGDSHTAGDMVSQGLRAALQARLGNAGRGMMPAGKPYQGYLSWGVTARQSAEWQGNALFGPQRHADGALLGFSGFTQTTTMPAATMSLTADGPATRFTRFTLCGLTGPDAGAVTVTFDGEPAEPISFSAPAPGAACFVRSSAVPVTQATVATLDTRTVSLTAWETRTGTPGVIVANLGVVGARAMHLARADDAVAGPNWPPPAPIW
jgi:lysophospholipase L1-like esterase